MAYSKADVASREWAAQLKTTVEDVLYSRLFNYFKYINCRKGL